MTVIVVAFTVIIRRIFVFAFSPKRMKSLFAYEAVNALAVALVDTKLDGYIVAVAVLPCKKCPDWDKPFVSVTLFPAAVLDVTDRATTVEFANCT